jgi:predicted RNA polymerase sigma factor
MLMRTTSSPVVAMNHAVATAMVHGPRAGLEPLAGLESDPRVASGHRLDACVRISSSAPAT